MTTFLALFLLMFCPCILIIGLSWFVYPKIIPINHQILHRRRIVLYNTVMFGSYFILMIGMILIDKSPKLTSLSIILSGISSTIASMGVSVWLTQRYQNFIHQTNQEIPITHLNTQTPSDTIPTTPPPTLNTPQHHEDWQAYKHRMEEDWQRTKQSFGKK